jgi:hypothetical protein
VSARTQDQWDREDRIAGHIAAPPFATDQSTAQVGPAMQTLGVPACLNQAVAVKSTENRQTVGTASDRGRARIQPEAGRARSIPLSSVPLPLPLPCRRAARAHRAGGTNRRANSPRLRLQGQGVWRRGTRADAREKEKEGQKGRGDRSPPRAPLGCPTVPGRRGVISATGVRTFSEAAHVARAGAMAHSCARLCKHSTRIPAYTA